MAMTPASVVAIPSNRTPFVERSTRYPIALLHVIPLQGDHPVARDAAVSNGAAGGAVAVTTSEAEPRRPRAERSRGRNTSSTPLWVSRCVETLDDVVAMVTHAPEPDAWSSTDRSIR